MNLLICHITTVHSYDDVRIFHKECVSLSSAGYRVILLASKTQVERNISDNFIIQPASRSFKNRILRMTLGGWRTYRRALKLKADVYHFHDPEFIPFALMLRRKGLKVIYDAHEDVPRQILSKHYFPSIVRHLIARLFRKYENHALRRMSAACVATPPMLRRYGSNCLDTVLIPNFPLMSEFPTVRNWDAREHAIAYVGGITEVRGIFQLVQMMERVDSLLYLGGRFVPDTLFRRVAAMPGWSKVKYLGEINREQVAEVLSTVKLGVVPLLTTPNHSISYPVKMFEYMASGIPVVASDIPLWREIIEKAQCGVLINPLDIQQMAHVVNYLLSNRGVAQAMGAQGREAVEAFYNWKTGGEKPLLNLYERIIAQNS